MVWGALRIPPASTVPQIARCPAPGEDSAAMENICPSLAGGKAAGRARREPTVLYGEQGVREGCALVEEGGQRLEGALQEGRQLLATATTSPAPGHHQGPPDRTSHTHQHKEQALALRGTGSGLAVALDNCRGGKRSAASWVHGQRHQPHHPRAERRPLERRGERGGGKNA